MTTDSVPGSLQKFARRLSDTYGAMTPESDLREQCLMTLTLATTMLSERGVRPKRRELPLQVAVIGPTQAGKSTVVNLLLGSEKAEASPLAGFTRKAAGFACIPDHSAIGWVSEVVGEGIHVGPVDCDSQPPSITWDTPDFDSHRSHDYRTLIARIGALADVFVLVVSKEKYSDLSVWEMMHTLQPLNRKVIVCLNKVSTDSDVLSAAVRNRVSECGWDLDRTPLIVLPHTPQHNVFQALSNTSAVEALRQTVYQMDNRCDADCRQHGLRAVFESNWETWLQPVRVEIGAARHWQQILDRHMQDAEAVYAQQYLDHSSHNDAFNRAVFQLLELLEIPGIARPLAKVRNVLTWPVRKVIQLFGNDGGGAGASNEATLIDDVVDHALLSLRTTISQFIDEPGQAGLWWHVLSRDYGEEADGVRRRLPGAISRYQENFAPVIQSAAQSLYARLQEKPVMLNALRVGRVGADAAGVLVAVKTGAVGVTEALLTPAMLSVTSILTESVAGKFMASVKDQLRERQRDLVRDLFRQEVLAPLLYMQNYQSNAALFRISEGELAEAERLKSELCA